MTTQPSPVAVTWRSGIPLPSQRPRVLGELFSAARRRAGSAVVLIDGDLHVTWDELDRWSHRLAGAWSTLIAAGDRVVIMAANSVGHLLTELATWRLGAIAVPLFSGQSQARIAALMQLIEPRLVICDDSVSMTTSIQRFSNADVLTLARSAGPVAERRVMAVDPCLILFTSGSSGQPRGVTLSHDNLCSQQAAFAALWPDVGPGDRLASYLPWHHSFGALAERLWALTRGAAMTLVPGGGRNHECFLATMQAVQPTIFMSVPKMHALVIEAQAVPKSLKWAFNAGAALPLACAQGYRERGIPVYEGWGLTETSPSATITPPHRPWQSGIVGEPIPGVDVGVTADGRILVRGPNVMLGYWRDATATAACVQNSDGHATIDSGDLGEWTAHGLRLLGRRDQQVKLMNGEKVDCAALELALQALPGVTHALVDADPHLIGVIDADVAIDDQQLIAALTEISGPLATISQVYRVGTPLSVESGLLTASLKIARTTLLQHFSEWRQQGGTQFRRVR